jgi:hypothetical protein
VASSLLFPVVVASIPPVVAAPSSLCPLTLLSSPRAYPVWFADLLLVRFLHCLLLLWSSALDFFFFRFVSFGVADYCNHRSIDVLPPRPRFAVLLLPSGCCCRCFFVSRVWCRVSAVVGVDVGGVGFEVDRWHLRVPRARAASAFPAHEAPTTAGSLSPVCGGALAPPLAGAFSPPPPLPRPPWGGLLHAVYRRLLRCSIPVPCTSFCALLACRARSLAALCNRHSFSCLLHALGVYAHRSYCYFLSALS